MEKHNNLDSNLFISAILPSDKILLEKTVQLIRPNSKNYEDSWGYIIQATRYLGLKWYDPQNNSLIFFGKKSEKDPVLVVVNYFAEPEYLKNVVDIVQKKLNFKKTIFKNVNPKDIPLLTPYGFRRYKENEYWDRAARFDDQTYPQLLIDLQLVTEAKGSKYHILRTALHKNPNIIVRKYLNTDEKNIFEILSVKDKMQNKSKEEKEKGMYYISHAMYPSSDTEKFVFLDGNTNRLIGFIATSNVTPTFATSVASIFLPEAKKVTIWCTYQVFLAKYKEGFKFINLGGCEFESTYNFAKEKYRPVEEIQKIHLIYP